LPEFKRTVLEVMHQPIEEGIVTISCARLSVEYPASFMLVASMNPCPCGHYNHPDKDCSCAPGIVQRYLNKISGPLLDRIDIHV
jgi:magnesium chelatase family protein